MSEISQLTDSFSPTQRRLFEALLEKEGLSATRSRITPRARPEQAPRLSFAQERLWFLAQLDPENPTYNVNKVLRLRGRLDHRALEAGLNEIVRRHEVLRTSFAAPADGEPVQVIAPHGGVPLVTWDLGRLPEEMRRRESRRLVKDQKERIFDLREGPLLRCIVLRMGTDDHVLQLSQHHIVSDAWSTQVLIREVGRLYSAFSRGEPSPLPELAIQYADFAEWQRQHLQGEVLESHLDYWRRELGSESDPLALPTDRPRPAVRTHHGSRQTDTLGHGLAGRVNELGREESATSFMVLLAAFQSLLHRYCAQTEVRVGTPIANRNREEVEDLIGFFVNTLVLRGDFSADPSFRELLGRVRVSALGAFEHQDLPFEKVVEALSPERRLSHTPLFQVLFVVQNVPREDLDLGEITLEAMDVPAETAKFDLNLVLSESGKDLAASLEYNTDLFDPSTTRRLLSHLSRLLAGALAAPDRRIAELPLLSEGENHQLLREWTARGPLASEERGLVELFEVQALSRAQAPALSFEDETWSYAELNRRANQLAHHLRRLGVGPEARVGLRTERSLEMVVGILGTLKAGGCYVPLDPAHPVERTRFMLEDSGCSVLLTQEKLAEGLPAFAGAVVCLDRDWPEISRRPAEDPAPACHGEQAAYVIYTSGSTGRPKGVAVTQHNVVRLFRTAEPWFGFAASDVWTLFHSYAFDFSVWELWGGLLYGGRVVVVPYGVSRSPDVFYELLLRQGVTVLSQTPSAFGQLAETEASSPALGELRLRYVVFGGEALNLASLRPWFERHGDRSPRLVNMYGITETTVHVTLRALGREDCAQPASLIGTGLGDLRVHVLDRHLQPLPQGVAGELHVGGGGVARGYPGHGSLTAQRFLPDPFSGLRGERLYRTGDLGRYIRRGELEYLGRVDHQVKVRGFRIEPGEIEAVLGRHPEVAGALVVVHEERPGDHRLVAYVVPGHESAGPVDEAHLASQLRGRVRDVLPEYMIPSAFVFLEAFPLTPNGKLDRRSLPAPEAASSTASGEIAAPTSSLEEALAEIWCQLLNRERIGIHDNFFELGGHSLLAIQVMNRVCQTFEAALPLRTLFEAPTLAELAVAVARHRGTGSLAPLPSVVSDPQHRAEPFPLTDIQQAYWIGRQGVVELGSVSAHRYTELELVSLDLEGFQRAIRQLIARHGMLRTIVLADGRQQTLERVDPYRIEVRDLRDHDRKEAERELEAVREEMSHQVLASDRWPLFEVRATCLDAGRVRVHLSFDVLLADALSFRILASELARLYKDPESPLVPLELSFRDYVLGELALQDSELYRRDRSYWMDRVPTLPPRPELPLARDPRRLDRPRFERRSALFDPETWARLKQRAGRAGLTASAVLAAAYAEVLAGWSKRSSMTLTLTLFHRLPLHPQVQQIVGDFTSLTLLEVRPPAGEPFRVRARCLQERLWADLEHRHFSGVRVLREWARLQGKRPGALMPVVFTSTINLPTAALGERASLSEDTRRVYGISQTPQVWLDNQVSEGSGFLAFTWDAVSGLFPEGLLDAMFAAYEGLLRRLAEDDEVWEAGRLELASAEPGARQQALGITSEAPPELLLTTLFDARVREDASRPAVQAPDRSLDYGELFRRSNQLGRRLRELGARPNQLVAVTIAKGWEQVVAALGVLRSGAAYVPIDPELPAKRREYLLEHTRAKLVVTRSREAAGLDLPAGIERILVDGEELAAVSSQPLEAAQGFQDLAYVIYTSGSTGLPKGVAIDHRGAVNTILDVNRRFAVGRDDRVLALSSLSFDLSVYDVFGTLAAGGTVVMPEAGRGRDPEHWWQRAEPGGVTVWNSVPALMEMFVEWLQGEGRPLPASLRLVLLSGDWIPVGLPDRIRALATSEIELISLGGATEASIWSIHHPIGEVDPECKSIPYGRALSGQEVYVLDETLEPRPTWVPGELYIAGWGLAREYWRDEEKTRRAYPTHPRTGERLYRTGDWGRLLPDGNIEFLGREDFQVKLRGHRIELGEIEAALERHPDVRAAAAKTVGPRRQAQLVAYYVLRSAPAGGAPGPQRPKPASARAPSSPVRRLAFKLSEPGLRRDTVSYPRVDLPPLEVDGPSLEARYLERRSHRRFAAQPIALDAFSRFMGCLGQVRFPGAALPKYRYGSAGNLYPVQSYLYVKPRRIEALDSGLYYYHPKEHQLVRIAADVEIGSDLVGEFNRPMFEAAAFCIFLIARLDAIEPIYGARSLHFSTLEAGLITQQLETTAPENGLGLCQIGALDFERIRSSFALGENHRLLHSLVGGALVTSSAGLLADYLEEQEIDPSVAEEIVNDPAFSSWAAAAPEASPPQPKPALDLTGFLQAQLPDYMVPGFFVELDALPLSANGKVDRGALPDPQESENGGKSSYVAPESELMRRIAAVVQEILEVERVGIHDNFFDLGGHSVHIVRIHAELQKKVDTTFPLVSVFEHPTVATLAARLGSDGTAASQTMLQSEERGQKRREAMRRKRRR